MSTDRSEYRIRLQQPWKAASSCVSDPNRADVRITTHEFRRIFQRPSGLDASLPIAIEVQVLQGFEQLHAVDCILNDCKLEVTSGESGRPQRFAVGHEQLRATNNQLLLRLVWTGDAPEVTLPNVALIL